MYVSSLLSRRSECIYAAVMDRGEIVFETGKSIGDCCRLWCNGERERERINRFGIYLIGRGEEEKCGKCGLYVVIRVTRKIRCGLC